MSSQPTWGLVATIKAPTRDILNFAAHHIDLGAHRLHIYLDAPNPQAHAALKAHPKCRVTLCDGTYWKRHHKIRPQKHQVRQSANATHSYRKDPQVDWLAHIDVDEFLWPQTSLPDQLAAMPDSALSARIRPVEALAPDPVDPPPPGTTWFKACAYPRRDRIEQTPQIYPDYGEHLDGGFLSHVAGKVMVRTGQDNISLRIHNAFLNGKKDEHPHDLTATQLCHLHAPSLDAWLGTYRFRLQSGVYRADLKPAPGSLMTMHQFFTALEAEGGEHALRTFYQQVCTATPGLRDRLAAFGLLRAIPLDLGVKRARYFPNHG